ncbi:DUF7683 domain-containing protein [Dyadobacter sp. OTU695]|uniref:DUF7683 domain-containing protein n=1 Tax=Dyadobacter sp. OTU695 TaxID=3043860 RepID=UPI00313B7A09
MNVNREIIWFRKGTEDEVGTLYVDQISLDELVQIFERYDDDPLMYMVYEVTPQQSSDLSRWVEHAFEHEKYDYFLYCWQAYR